MNPLEQVRARIDELDERIQNLISERARCAQEIARIKRERGDTADFYRPEREAQILERVRARNRGPLDDETLLRLFREIMSACLALQQPLTVAYLGPRGTFTELAVLKHFGHAVRSRPLAAIDEVFREVEAGSVPYGVVPVENSSEGVVTHTLDMFIDSPLKICGEVLLRVHHHLLSRAPSLEAVRTVYAHQQALAQCREWLAANLPGVPTVAVSSNAEGARLAAEREDAAALGSDHAAELYGLSVLASNVEDEPDNTTRFLIIGRQDVPPSGRDKTSLMVAIRNKPGALHQILAPLADHEIDMTRIESRPSRRAPWDYVFFIDILGHKDERSVQRALRAVEREAALLKLLGSYPCAVL
ncbi:MAG: chorismate mutase [Gammaproteobacteria bacterium]|nr:MAG: chorismate mutase [Gammaproteobacteria bacterium]